MPDSDHSDLVLATILWLLLNQKEKGEAILTCTVSEFRDHKFCLLGKFLQEYELEQISKFESQDNRGVSP